MPLNAAPIPLQLSSDTFWFTKNIYNMNILKDTLLFFPYGTSYHELICGSTGVHYRANLLLGG